MNFVKLVFMFSGILLSILPVLYFFAKPLVGLLVDYFSVSVNKILALSRLLFKNISQKARKAIFMMIIATMSISFGCYMFLPQQSNRLSFNVTEVQRCDHLVN